MKEVAMAHCSGRWSRGSRQDTASSLWALITAMIENENEMLTIASLAA
jgi:hypothetical protein